MRHTVQCVKSVLQGNSWRRSFISGWLVLALLASSQANGNAGLRQGATDAEPASRGIEIVQVGGYPELRVDGKPFFIHSAAFFYYRMPRDLWDSALDDYRSLGINTIDIYIPWNWHQPSEGEFDFDGHTNPRRNLRALLQLIARKKLKLIARPGPTILNEWRNGGYPDWLLARPEYKMPMADILEGRYPPLSNLNARDSEAAAQGWLQNPVHMEYAEKWMTTVARELATYSSHRLIAIPGSGDSSTKPEKISGPLLFVQLEDDMAIGRTNTVGSDFWKYMRTLRGWLQSGGLDAVFFINPTDMRVTAAGSGLDEPIGAMGQWYMPPQGTGARQIDENDATTIELYADELKTQPDFPAAMVEFQAGWYCPGDDDRPHESPPYNTLLASRLLIGQGIHGINYFPLQDTLTPAGYAVPWANRFYRWDAALGVDGSVQPRARAVIRNRDLLARWGTDLAGSHKRTDFAIVDPLGSFSQAALSKEEVDNVRAAEQRLETLAQIAHLSTELADPEFQPADQLLRYPILMLPVFDPSRQEFQMSARAQGTIVDYVRRGGTLIVFPGRPAGKIIDDLWKESPPVQASPSGDVIQATWQFGAGQVIESSKDFLTAAKVEEPWETSLSRAETTYALHAILELFAKTRVRASVKITGNLEDLADLVASEIVSDEGSQPLGMRSTGRGFLSVTNLGDTDIGPVGIQALSPEASARGERSEYLVTKIAIPAHDSLLLPLLEPICPVPQESSCNDVATIMGAEFLDSRIDDKDLVLSLYTPARAELRLKLGREPSEVQMDELKQQIAYDDASQTLSLEIPRGPSPTYNRTLRLGIHEKQPEKNAHKNPSGAFTVSVPNGIRLPLGRDAFLKSNPPLILTEKKNSTELVVEADSNNTQKARQADVQITGPFTGSGSLRLEPKSTSVERIKLHAAGDKTAPDEDGLVEGAIDVHSGQDRFQSSIDYLIEHKDGETNYRYDFDRDGAKEWVMESKNLRLIVSPESGGRALALVEKNSGLNLISSVGGLRDGFSFTENSSTGNPERARGRYGLFNRPYRARWTTSDSKTALQMDYYAPDVFPNGAAIEKTMRFEDPDTIRIEYKINLHAPSAGQTGSTPQSFVTSTSVPALSIGDRTTQFCWSASNGEQQPDTNKKTSEVPSCKDFAAGGPPIQSPLWTSRVEVHTPGEPDMAIDWQGGTMTIEPKGFSALLRLQFPPLAPGADASYTVSVHLLGVE